MVIFIIQKLKKMKKTIVPLLIIILAIFSCDQMSRSDKATDPSLYYELIQAYTSGIISSGDPITIQLNKLPELTGMEKELESGVFKLSPSKSGTLRWLDSKTLVFTPDEDWKSGREYEASLNLKEFWKVDKELSTFNFNFSIVNLDFTVVEPGLKLIDNGDADSYRYEGQIITSDEINTEILSSFFELDIPTGSKEIKVESSGPNTYKYLIDSLPVNEESYTIKVKWDGRKKDIDQKGELALEVPGKDQFSIIDVKVDQGESQMITVYFSGQLDYDQDLSGLIHIDGSENIRLSKRGNQVEVYPTDRIDGECELIIEPGIRNSKGKSLNSGDSFNLALEPIKPQVEFIGSGVIMPDSKELYLPFKAVSLRAVDIKIDKIYASNITQFLQTNQFNGNSGIKYVGRPVFRKSMRLDDDTSLDLLQWNNFSLDLADLIQDDPHALYRVRLSFKKPYSVYQCEDQTDENIEDYFEHIEFRDDEIAPFNDARYFYESYYPDGYLWRERENPCHNSYFTQEKFPARNILSTNLGLIVKSSDHKKFTVAVSDLLSVKPVSDVNLSFLNYQKVEIANSITDKDGFSEVELEEVPFIVVATAGDQKAYLRLDDGSSLSLSNFDVSGQEVQKGIKGMIIGERGVWRPGDTLFLTFLLEDRNILLPDKQPVNLNVFNSRGQLASTMVKTVGVNGFYTFSIPTQAKDPTGNWTAQIQVGGAKFEKTLKIETIKPNRLKIDLKFTSEPLMPNEPGQTATITSTWLHGAVARGLESRVGVRLVKDNKGFPSYPGYSFWDPARQYWPIEREVFKGILGSNGTVSFDLDLPIHNQLPGPMKAVFTTRVLEKGGDYSIGVQSFGFAPYNRFVGVKIPEGKNDRKMLETDQDHIVKIASVDANGSPLDINNLEVSVYKISWRWWWSAGEDNLANYIGGSDTRLISKEIVSTQNGHGSIPVRIEYPDWGRYYIKVLDPETGHSCGEVFYVDWPYSVNRGNRENPAGATMLSFTSEKDTAQIGDKVNFTFPSSGQSRALVSLEKGTGVIDKFWVDCDEAETSFSLKITPEMTPNIYVHLSLLQPHEQTKNDLPLRLYGMVPLTVIDLETQLHPEITFPESIRPNESYRIKVKEKNGKPMSYTIAVVDEGLLDLTRFKTPDPWQFFNAKEALGVKTWDLYDDVLGAFGGKIGKMLAIGGDEEALLAEDNEANRFKPVVEFLGPFELESGKTGTHNIKMSNYIGSVKAMVIAGNGKAWGSSEAIAPVKQPVMVLATAPRILGPGEKMTLPISLFVLEEKIKEADIILTTSGPLKISGPEKKKLFFNDIGEYPAAFELETTFESGTANILVQVNSGKEKASYEVELMVRNPNPYTSRIIKEVLEAGKDLDVDINFHGTQGTNKGTIEVSSLPDFEIKKKLDYLVAYPYGCIEQTTSAGFAQLNLDQLVELESLELSKIQVNLQATLNKIAGFQLPDGSFSYWPGVGNTSDWASSYAAHFFLLASEKGYVLPSNMKKKWLKYQYNEASKMRLPEGDSYPDIVFLQAYRLYTLALAGKPNRSAMNRLRESHNLSSEARWRLAAAYALAGRKEVATQLVLDHDPKKTRDYKTPGRTFGSRLRDQAMILETLCLMELDEDAFELIIAMAEDFKGNWHSTQTSAFTLHSLAQFAEIYSSTSDNEFEIIVDRNKQTIKPSKPVYSIDLDPELAGKQDIRIANKGLGSLFVSTTTRGKALPGEEEAAQSNLLINSSYSDMSGESIDIDNLQQGTDFIASIQIRNPGLMGEYENLALSLVVPSGWEIRNLRLFDQDNSLNKDPYVYQDIRDDRVNTFFMLGPNESRTYNDSPSRGLPGKVLFSSC